MKSPLPSAGRRVAGTWPIFVLVVFLAGCSSDGGGDWLALFDAARTAWVNRDAAVGLNDAASIPYATLGVRMDGGREQILILATDNNGERLWTSAARVAIATRDGRIVRTAGFGTDLTGYSAMQGGSANWTQPHTYAWVGDFADLGLYSVTITCEVRPAGPEPITILGTQLDTVRVDEACHSDKLNWSFENTYWVSASSGRVWRSIEQVHPKGPVFEIELLRPPLSSG